ncbi:hypothetical protein HHK36_003982 [Tetracentron sinense]|uniref:Uncharacterized protein n=2 Tax=Magnoliopsida TaxID=3398 RepID=A0A835DP34_TETSI|nr:hypothetical protein HHK36_003982 [Tetracentron sinense]
MTSPVNVPRWTPSPSPARSPRHEAVTRVRGDDDMEVDSIASEEDDNSYSTERIFPFSTFSSPPSPPPMVSHIKHIYSAPSLRTDPQSSLEVETVPWPNQGEKTDVMYDAVRSPSQASSVYLTWEDLWVTVSNGKSGPRPILQGLTGYAQPGEVLAIMGPSGCGKSTLLDSLAGRLDSNTRQTGKVLINGRKQKLAFGTSAYVTQDDTLMTTLTVKEAIYYSAQLQLPDSMSVSEKKERAEITIREMGLQDAMNTRIGGWSSKGLSGGQKRRVSICIEILTRPKLLFLDEPTSGLDSAASYHVMNRIVSLARQDGRTVIASIHQPSSEVFELFHNLCLLSYGKTIYFGSASAANEFYALNGFPCPTLRNPSDHYLRTINKDFDMDIEQGLGNKTTEESIDILVKSYKSSATFQQVRRRVIEICKQEGGALEKKGSQSSFITQSLVLTRRSFVNMYRDLGYYWLRFAIYIALCLCVGTIFYDIGTTYSSIQIFGRERLNGHYGVGAFVVGNTLSSIPYLFIISLIPGAIAYYLVGLQRGIEHFVFFTLLLFISIMLVESIMMMVASIVPDFLMGIITGAGIQGVMMLNGGFFRLPDDLPKPFWRYPMYYIAFHKYANQGFYKNEFEGLTFPNNQAGGPSTINGEEILRNVWQVEMGYSKWVDLAILLGMVVLYRLMFFGIIKIAEKVKPTIRALMAAAPPKQTKQIMENPSSTSAYVTQDDTLMTTLTVKEAVYYSAQLQLPDSMSISEKKERSEITIREMGLQDAMNTRIGGWSTKGLSGGQKRRVSICIEILTRPKLLFLDEPTSGLDSAASYHVMNRIVSLARQDGRTVIASIHQPSSEVFELFHNLCLLSYGKTIYFGPASKTNEFYALNDFPCPTLRNPSDHYLRTINKDFDMDIERGLGSKTTEESIDILVKSYKSSETFQQVRRQVIDLCKQERGALEKKGSQSSFITQCFVLTRRFFVNMYRDLGYYWLRFAIYITLCLCVGTIFYDIGSTFGSIQARSSMLVFVASFLTFMAIGGFPSFVEDMKIFRRERLTGHYSVGAFIVGNTLSSIPYLLIMTLIPGAIAYHLVGLQRGFEHFCVLCFATFHLHNAVPDEGEMEGDMDVNNADIEMATAEADAVKELDEMKKRLKEMEEEAAALREMQAKVEKEMGAVQDPATAAATQASKEEADSRSVFVGNGHSSFFKFSDKLALEMSPNILGRVKGLNFLTCFEEQRRVIIHAVFVAEPECWWWWLVPREYLGILRHMVDYSCTPEEVQQHFQSCGTVNRVTILTDKFGQPKGFAYVEFLEVEAVQEALLLNESELHGRQLKVSAKRTNVPGMKQFQRRGFNPYMGYRFRRPYVPSYFYPPGGYGYVSG